MTGCQTCGGYGMHHDPIAHGWTKETEVAPPHWQQQAVKLAHKLGRVADPLKPIREALKDAYDRGCEAGYREGLDDAAAETGR